MAKDKKKKKKKDKSQDDYGTFSQLMGGTSGAAVQKKKKAKGGIPSGVKIGDPIVYTIYEPEFLLGPCPGMVTINPQYMLEGEHKILVDKIKNILSDSF